MVKQMVQIINGQNRAEKCLLVIIEFRSEKDSWPKQDVARELEELVKTAGGQVVDRIFSPREKATPDLLIGKGKAEEIALVAQELEANTVVFSHDISGTQQRNLEEIINMKTIDRTQLILDIFCRHAHSPEGKTQVELAQLEYLLPRLTGKGIILSRLGGGIGTRGPGEQKLEVDRRRIRKRITKLKQDLNHLTSHRRIMRKKRRQEALPCIVLVGYTNAGKSTLINALTGASQDVENSLFTTLDSLSRRLQLPSGLKIIVSDTVGFLHNLPHHLIEAFQATLEEVVEADLLIHVLDANHPRIQEQNKAVFDVLEQLNCKQKPMIVALNKIDILEDKAWLGWLEEKFTDSACISAKTKENLNKLIEKIEVVFKSEIINVRLCVPLNQMSIVDLIYRQAKVISAEYDEKNVRLAVNIAENQLHNLLKYKGIKVIN